MTGSRKRAEGIETQTGPEMTIEKPRKALANGKRFNSLGGLWLIETEMIETPTFLSN
jgi:hypothetical protein